jgi:integral membrane protein
MSFVTGTTLITLCVIWLIQHGAPGFWKHNEFMHALLRIDGVGHGVVLYPLYMIMCFNMVLKFRLNVALLGLMFFAGFVPGLAFYLEHRMRRRLYPNGLPAK